MTSNRWKTRRFIVELPVQGDQTQTSLAYEIADAWNGRKSLYFRNSYGRIRVKDYNRWAASRRKKK